MISTTLQRPTTGQSEPTDPLAAVLAVTLRDPSKLGRYLNANNDWTGRSDPVERAARSGRSYMIDLAPYALGADLDTDVKVAKGRELAEKMKADRRPVLFIPSGRPNHFHLFAVVADPEDREWWRSRAEELGIPFRTVMRPPGSPHRITGQCAELGPDAVDFLAAIKPELDERVANDHRRHAMFWLQTLRTGKRFTRPDKSPSALAWIVTQGAARAGWSFEQLQDALDDPYNAGGAAYRNRGGKGAKKADTWLRTVWTSAHKLIQEAPPRSTSPEAVTEDIRIHHAKVRAAIDLFDWSGKGGASDRAVVLTLLKRAEEDMSWQPKMSHRDIEKAANLSRKTVGRSVHRTPFLSVDQPGYSSRTPIATNPKTGKDQYSTASVWNLHIPRHLEEQAARNFPKYLVTRGGVSVAGELTRALDDLGRWGKGIGPNGRRVIEELEASGPMEAAELADRLHLNLGNLRYRLLPKTLAFLGLVECEGKQWRVVDDLVDAVKAAAAHQGLAGKTEAVKDRISEERAKHNEWREDGSPRSDEAIVKELDAREDAEITPEVRELNERLADNLPDIEHDPTIVAHPDELAPILDPDTGEMIFLRTTETEPAAEDHGQGGPDEATMASMSNRGVAA